MEACLSNKIDGCCSGVERRVAEVEQQTEELSHLSGDASHQG
jgi:hypothetical protein